MNNFDEIKDFQYNFYEQLQPMAINRTKLINNLEFINKLIVEIETERGCNRNLG